MKVIGKSKDGYIVTVGEVEMADIRRATGMTQDAEVGDDVEVGPALGRLDVLKRRASETNLAEKLSKAADAVRELTAVVER